MINKCMADWCIENQFVLTYADDEYEEYSTINPPDEDFGTPGLDFVETVMICSHHITYSAVEGSNTDSPRLHDAQEFRTADECIAYLEGIFSERGMM